MASRDIANMHVFLDLKKKFPDLPDETLRSYISLFAEDQEKCISLLQKESDSHYHPSQPFSDLLLPENKVNSKRNDGMKHFTGSPNEHSNPFYFVYPDMPTCKTKIMPPPPGRSSHAGVVHSPRTLLNTNMLSKPESFSAPVITSSEKPFTDMYKQNSVSSHATLCHLPNDGNSSSNQMMFSTTKEHKIEPPETHLSTAYLIAAEPEQSKRHAVKLSITPSFPFQQQHVNVFNNSVCATASHSSRPGRHTTSLNFQLQPHSSDQFPLEISTIPTNIGDLCNSRDFGSHVQISVDSQGATFTALRLQQRPNYSQTTSHLVSTEGQYPNDYAVSSSQIQNSNLHLYPGKRMQELSKMETNTPFQYLPVQNLNIKSKMNNPSEHLKAQFGSISSPDYVLAVKNHQIAQLDLIVDELEKEKKACSQLRAEVNRMEKEITEKCSSNASFPFAEELNKLREENKRLMIECNCLYIEAEEYYSTDTPPLEKDDFYTQISSGPNGAITTNSKGTSKKDSDIRQNPSKPSFEEDDDDERNRWICKKCTFANHPALEKCEMCELPKDTSSLFDD